MPIRILRADDHTIMQQGPRQILEHEADFAIVAEAGSGLEVIEQVQEGEAGATFFSPAVAKVFRNGCSDLHLGHTHRHLRDDIEDPFGSLTERERPVYQMLAEGNCNKDIANRLDLSLHTVETHRWRIMEKMNLHSMAELVLSAMRRGMVS
jgi:two-component system, NarL family, response regulator NreC